MGVNIIIAGITLTPARQALFNRYMSTPLPNDLYPDYDQAERVLMKLDQWREHIRRQEAEPDAATHN